MCLQMKDYVKKGDSIAELLGYNTKEIAKAVAQRYMKDNPSCDYTFRMFLESGIEACEDFRYDMDFEKIFPNIKHRQRVNVYTKLWSKDDKDFFVSVNTNCPFTLFLDGILAYKSSIHEETDFDKNVFTKVRLKKGWNFFTISMIKVNSGCRAIFGGGYKKSGIVNFLVPVIQREGQAGFVFTEPQDNELDFLIFDDIDETQLNVYPKIEMVNDNFAELFECSQGYVVAKTVCLMSSDDVFSITLKNYSPIELYIDNVLCYSSREQAVKTIDIPLKAGEHNLIAKIRLAPEQWGFAVSEVKNGTLIIPNNIKGGISPWIFSGVFDRDIAITEFYDIHKLIDNKYWITPVKNSYIRAYQEEHLYGLWNYPLGVALYGFLQVGKNFEIQELIDYAIGHINLSASMYSYAKWEREKFVTTYVNQQISEIDMLDDCGSFGKAMLTANAIGEIANSDIIANDIADYMLNKQERTEEGAFIRIPLSRNFMKYSIWADDLFMGSSFLVEYYKKSKDVRYIDLAAKQYIEYKKYLWNENTRLLSHVYSIRYRKANLITWGRGLGWVLFSLSELLMVMPEKHKDKEWLICFFADLCEQLIKYQGKNGLWHQVVDDDTSYYETSCTAMYICAIIRGLNNGYVDNSNHKFDKAAISAWKGIVNHCIDKKGNISGVCKGSGYSFNVDYYKDELNSVKNDTHGIGIVILAAMEIHNWFSI